MRSVGRRRRSRLHVHVHVRYGAEEIAFKKFAGDLGADFLSKEEIASDFLDFR